MSWRPEDLPTEGATRPVRNNPAAIAVIRRRIWQGLTPREAVRRTTRDLAEGKLPRQIKPRRSGPCDPMRPTDLYRCFDGCDRLLYVGIAVNVAQRLREHVGDPWWKQVVRSTTEHFTTRTAARKAETAAIRAEHPIYNVDGRGVDAAAEAVRRYAATGAACIHERTVQVTVCADCGRRLE